MTLFAGPGSEFEAGRVVVHGDEIRRPIPTDFDAYIDSSHRHAFGRSFAGPVLNRIGDLESPAGLPRMIVESEYMGRRYAGARVVPKGVDTWGIPYYPFHGGATRYVGQLIAWKGFYRALDVARESSRPVEFAGENLTGLTDAELKRKVPTWIGVLTGRALWDFIGMARCIIHLSQGDASPRLPIEAQAAGTPVICLRGDGAENMINPGVTGIACNSISDVLEAIEGIDTLSHMEARKWAVGRHSMRFMIDAYEQAIEDMLEGLVW